MINHAAPTRLFDLGKAIDRPALRTLWRFMEQPVGRLLALEAVNDVYERTLRQPPLHNYFASILDVLDVGVEILPEDRAVLETPGPLMIVANHPFGAVEGVVLGDLMSRARNDARLLGNHLLHTVPELRPFIIPVDPFGGSAATTHNVGPMKASLRWLRNGGALGVFPAGAVSHLHVRQGRVVDPPWHTSVAALARRSGATVVPMFFEGRNSLWFQMAGLLHAGLRTALIPSELMKRAGSRIRVRVGKPIEPKVLQRYQDDETLISYLRWKTHLLGHHERVTRPRRLSFPVPVAAMPEPEPLVDAVLPGLLAAEIAALPEDALLCAQSDQRVYVARAAQIPAVLREIGRLRELSFRAVSEGTGKSLDLDRYDDSYLHLFLWNATSREIIGSYRIGLADELLAKQRLAGLYTHSLFKFRGGFLPRLGPALELGRSFIRPEYQRRPLPLALLWRGIGEFVVRNPRYKILFGPVSISRDYHGVSRRIMIEALRRQRGDEDLASLVAARNPPRDKLLPDERLAVDRLIRDVDDISDLVAEIEGGDKGMPILLRHYLKLGARLLAFNVDRAFGDCIDGLIVVDLRTTDDKILKRFMGEEGLRKFRGKAAGTADSLSAAAAS